MRPGATMRPFRVDDPVGACRREMSLSIFAMVSPSISTSTSSSRSVPGIDEAAVPYEDGQLSPPESR